MLESGVSAHVHKVYIRVQSINIGEIKQNYFILNLVCIAKLLTRLTRSLQSCNII